MVAEIEGRPKSTFNFWRQSARELILLIEYNFIFIQITYFKVHYKRYGNNTCHIVIATEYNKNQMRTTVGLPPFKRRNWLKRRSQWPRGLRRRSLAARLLRLRVRIPPRAWMFVCCECCVLSGRGLCDGLIIPSEESYRMWRVVVCDQETSQARRLKPTRGL